MIEITRRTRFARYCLQKDIETTGGDAPGAAVCMNCGWYVCDNAKVRRAAVAEHLREARKRREKGVANAPTEAEVRKS